MNISFGQIIVILLVGFLLFGNLPNKVEQWAKALKHLRDVNTENKAFQEEEKKDSTEAKTSSKKTFPQSGPKTSAPNPPSRESSEINEKKEQQK